MAANEAELRALMRASLAGDAYAHRTLLNRLSANLRVYYKTRLARIGRSATEAEDLTQEVCLSQIKSGRIGDANRPEWSGE
jgi:RNA polymerase sigma-70 factor (ECF subfamily)